MSHQTKPEGRGKKTFALLKRLISRKPNSQSKDRDVVPSGSKDTGTSANDAATLSAAQPSTTAPATTAQAQFSPIPSITHRAPTGEFPEPGPSTLAASFHNAQTSNQKSTEELDKESAGANRESAGSGYHTPPNLEYLGRGRPQSRHSHLSQGQNSLHSRNTSHASSVKTDDSRREEILPENVDCKLRLYLDEKELPMPEQPIPIAWFKKESFESISTAAEKRVEAAKSLRYREIHRCNADADLPLPGHYLQDGSFKVVGKIHSTPARKLEHKSQIVEVLVIAICGFIARRKREVFHIEIKWNYSTRNIEKVTGTPYRFTIINAIFEKTKQNFAGAKYVPRSDVNQIVSTTNSHWLVDEDTSLTDKEAFKDKIRTKAERLLAVCIHARLDLAFLDRLLSDETSNFSDQNVPTNEEQRPEGISPADFQSFLTYAPMFFAHKFGEEETENCDIPADIVVPMYFKEKDHLLGYGAFSEVFKVTIHPTHHKFNEDRTQAFALKRFKVRPNQSDEKRREKFDQERKMLRMLKRFRNSHNDHIVTHLTAWTQDGTFYILFPLATCNLKEFMECLPHKGRLPNLDIDVQMPHDEISRCPKLDGDFVLWILDQFHGLAAGMKRVHQLRMADKTVGLAPVVPAKKPDATGFHHDIKPDNILVFVDGNHAYGVLKIGDFGSGHAEVLTRSGGYKDTPFFVEKSNGAPTYESPDIYMTERASRKADVWSLGCVFLEILTWIFFPYEPGGRSFSTERCSDNNRFSGPGGTIETDDRFWCPIVATETQNHPNVKPIPAAKINESVQRRLKTLAEVHCKGKPALETVTKCTSRMLEIDRTKRIDATALATALEAVYVNAQADLTKDEKFYCGPGLNLSTEEILKPFPTPTTVFADREDNNLPNLEQSSSLPNLLSPRVFPPQNIEDLPGVPRTSELLAAGSHTEDQDLGTGTDLHNDDVPPLWNESKEGRAASDPSLRGQITGQTTFPHHLSGDSVNTSLLPDLLREPATK